MLGVTLVGVDGSRWNLRNGPVQLTRGSFTGLAMRTPKYQESETARGHGSRVTSWKFDKEKAVLPLKWNILYAHDITGLQRQFWEAIFSSDVDKQCSLEVTDGDGSTRTLYMRFVDDGNIAYSLDPYTWQDPFTLTFQANDPWWYGDEVSVPFDLGSDSTSNFFGGGDASVDGYGPPFYLSPGAGSGADQVHNGGSAEAWPVWTITAGSLGVSYFRFGVSGAYISSDSINMSSGDVLEINTDPTVQVALLNGVDVTRELEEVGFSPVPPGGFVDVSIDLTGSALVEVALYPRYARAF